MRFQTRIIFGLTITALCWSQEVPLYFGETSYLDKIAELTGTPSQTGATALELLELVALGRTSAIRAGAESQLGLTPGVLRDPRFAQPSVRVSAFQKIGECDLPEALEFLKNLKRADLGEDPTQMIWPNSRMALRTATLRRITDPQAKIEYLMSTLAEGDGRGSAGSWAAGLLCDQGVSNALPLIRRSYRNTWSGQRGADAIAFCEARIEVLSRHPDRIKALASVLTLDDPKVSNGLISWAVYHLATMHSAIADAELDRFANELDKLRQGAPNYLRAQSVSQEMRGVRREVKRRNR